MATMTDEIFEFIEETLEKSESVLIHSSRGQSRASAVIAV
jgi:protein-tyrosine phosphatase